MNFLPGTYRDGEVEIAGFGRGPIAGDQLVDGASPGDVTVGLRPETLAILFEGESAERTAAGEVVERAYYGDMTTYGVLIDGAVEPVWISMENLEGRRVLEPGDRSVVSWDPRALVLFPG